MFIDVLLCSKDEIHEENAAKLSDALSSCFSGMHKFRSLQTFHLGFWPFIVDEHSISIPEGAEDFITRQLLLLDAVMFSPQGPPPFSAFIITNALQLHRLDFGYIPLLRLFPHLTTLNLSMLSNKEWSQLLDDGLDCTSLIVEKWALDAMGSPHIAPLVNMIIRCTRGILLFDVQPSIISCLPS